MAISVKRPREIEKMTAAGRLVAECHQRIEPLIQPGVTTQVLDDVVREAIAEAGGTASFLGYGGFPASICASVNEEIVHGFPGPRQLVEGDIISVDIGAILDGWHGDSAWTYPVGEVSEEAARLLRDTEQALALAIEQARPGNRLGAIGHAVEAFAAPLGYGIVRGYGGHGIGRQMHEAPHVPNFGSVEQGPQLRPGMTLAIEPMLMTGGEETKVLGDEWTVVTRDGSLAAHFEHTVAVTEDEPLLLTKRLARVVN